MVIAIIKVEVYIVNSLRANLLIGNNVIVPNHVVLYPGTGKMVIGSCQNTVVNIITQTKVLVPV